MSGNLRPTRFAKLRVSGRSSVARRAAERFGFGRPPRSSSPSSSSSSSLSSDGTGLSLDVSEAHPSSSASSLSPRIGSTTTSYSPGGRCAVAAAAAAAAAALGRPLSLAARTLTCLPPSATEGATVGATEGATVRAFFTRVARVLVETGFVLHLALVECVLELVLVRVPSRRSSSSSQTSAADRLDLVREAT